MSATVSGRARTASAVGIDRPNPRMVCVAAGFSRHDRVVVRRLRERIDLVSYRVFDRALLSLLLVESPPRSTRGLRLPRACWRRGDIRRVRSGTRT